MGTPVNARPGPPADTDSEPDLRIAQDSLDHADVRELLRQHMQDMLDTSPPESVHALTATELAENGVNFWTVRASDGSLLACGALKQLNPETGELKSMRTVPSARGRGVGAALLEHLIREARARGYRCLKLETGTQPFFAPARRLYERAGFTETTPFADYSHDPHSVYLGLRLR
jgi:putative acetyltransferase